MRLETRSKRNGFRLANNKQGPSVQKFTLTTLAAATLLSASGAFAAPGVPNIDVWTLDQKNFTFVDINLENADGSHAYKDIVKRNEKVLVDLPFSKYSGGHGVKAVAVVDGVVDPSSEVALTVPDNPYGGQSGKVTTDIKTPGKKQVQVRLIDANGDFTDSRPYELVVFDTIPELADDLPDRADKNNKKFVQSTNGVVGTYFTSWSVYGRNYFFDQIPFDNLTHILFGFVPICGDSINEGIRGMEGEPALKRTCRGLPDYSVAMHDHWAELGKALQPYSGKPKIKGVMGQMMAAKKKYPHLKILPSIGGWTLSDPFYRMHDPANRKIFIDSVEEYLRTWKFFDGVDIDWEFPGGNGATAGLGNKETDGELYVTLMKELREMLDRLSKEYGKTYELTSAIGSPAEKVNVIDYKKATQYMDYLFDMTYDFHGAFDLNKLGHLTSLYAPKGGPATKFTTNDSVEALLAQGVDPKKIVVGVAQYGRGWVGVHDYKDGNPFTGKATGPHPGPWEAGNMPYKDIVQGLLGPDRRGINGYEYNYDETAEGPYAFNKSTGALMTFDDPRSVLAKGRYVRERQLGGLFSWEINADNGDILNAMNQGLGNKERGSSDHYPPIARTTPKVTVQGAQSVRLDASNSSHPDGAALTFKWEQTSGKTLAIKNASNPVAMVDVPEVDKTTQYGFRVTVTEPSGLSATATTMITAEPKQKSENRPPVARLTGPASVNAGESVTLSAAGSSDPDGDKLSFTWTVPQGIQATRNGAKLTFVAPALDKDTSFIVTVKVSDGKLSATASHTVVVKAKKSGGENLPPVARIAGPTSANAGQSVTLSAAASSDPNGDKLSFSWIVPHGIQAKQNGATLSFTAPELDKDTNVTISVKVSDGKLSASASHTVTVKAKSQHGGDDNYPKYKPGTRYQAGDIVLNDGSLYQCKPFPYSGWCSLAPAAYEPGKGTAWNDAWNLYKKGEEGGGGKQEDDNDYPLYKEGTAYKSGDIVTNDGKLYRCKPFPYGGWCSQAGWAYEPGKGTVWNDAWEEYKR